MGSKEGEPFEYTQLMTPEQIEVMESLGRYIEPRIGQTATPYSGALSAQYDPAQLAAMNVMMSLGGQGGYNAPDIPVGAQAMYSDLGDTSPGTAGVTPEPPTVGPIFGPGPEPPSPEPPNVGPMFGPGPALEPLTAKIPIEPPTPRAEPPTFGEWPITAGPTVRYNAFERPFIGPGPAGVRPNGSIQCFRTSFYRAWSRWCGPRVFW